MSKFTENHVKDYALEWLSGLGYTVAYGRNISPDGPILKLVRCDQVLLTTRLREALGRLNPHPPAENQDLLLPKLMSAEIRLAEAEEAVEALA